MNDTNQTFSVGAIIKDIINVVLTPVSFYKSMPQSGGLANPIIFVLLMGAITSVVLAFYSLLGIGFRDAGFLGIIFYPIIALISSFIGGVVLFVVWKLMGSEKSYAVAYRCVAYSLVIMPIMTMISFIPYVEGIVGPLWGCFLMFVSSKEVHGIKGKTAMIFFGVLAAVGVLLSVGSESMARKFSSKMDQIEKGSNELSSKLDQYKKLGQSEEGSNTLQELESMTPEELGENAGKIIQGLNKAMEDAKINPNK